MKKITAFILTLCMVMSLAACGQQRTQTQQPNSNSGTSQNNSGGSTSQQEPMEEPLNWPNRTITLYLGFKAGGNADYYTRLLAQSLEQQLGVSVVVVNIEGSNGAVAARELMNCDPDGYSVMMCQGVMLYQQYRGVVSDMNYLEDFEMGGMLCADNTFVMVARADSGVKTIGDLIEAAKNNPDEISFNGSFAGLGEYVIQQIAADTGVLIETIDTGANTVDRVASVLNGTCNAFAVDYSSVEDYITTGELVVLGNCSAERCSGLPDIPTLIEQGINANATKYYYLQWPKGTDSRIIEAVSDAMKNLAEDPAFAEALATTYGDVSYMDVGECTEFLNNMYESMLAMPEI